MGSILRRYCPKCGYQIDPNEDRFCLSCGERIIQPDEEPALSDKDFKDIPIIEKSPVEQLREKNGTVKRKDPWLSGSYYLVIIALLLTLFLSLTNIINSLFLPLVLIITLLGISLLGAFQMRFDKTYKATNFLKLIFLAFKKFLSGHGEADKPKIPQKPIKK
jgi:hypothetical protein